MFILCDPDATWRTDLRQRLSSGSAVIELDDLPAVRAALDDVRAATTVFLGPNLDTTSALAMAEGIETAGRPVSAVLVLDKLDTAIMRRALRVGVADVLTPDSTADELAEAIQRAQSEASERGPVMGPGGDGEAGRLITVFSTKGGCGKSLVASNLAILLAQQDSGPVALVDLDLQSGDLAIMLQVMPDLSIYDAAQSIDRMDADALVGYLTVHDSGISLLAAPLEPSLSEAVAADAVASILSMLRERFAYVVVDGPGLLHRPDPGGDRPVGHDRAGRVARRALGQEPSHGHQHPPPARPHARPDPDRAEPGGQQRRVARARGREVARDAHRRATALQSGRSPVDQPRVATRGRPQAVGRGRGHRAARAAHRRLGR